jgi:hypothetical protein
MMFSLAVISQVASSFFMTGVIWIIQIVHYPTFLFIDSERFFDFQSEHVRRITPIVGPVMLVELLSGLLLVWTNPSLLWILNITAITLIWILTFTLSVPLHDRLQSNNSDGLKKRLIQTNWPRTLVWTGKSLLLSLSLINWAQFN